MTEPYRKVGRGGAGNFYSKEDVKNVVATASTPSTLESQPPLSPSTPQSPTTQQPPDYTHTGRGGAGNYVQPSTLPPSSTDSNSTSLDPSPNPSSYIPSIVPAKATTPSNVPTATYKGGRGGAGNYSWSTGAAVTEEGKEEKEKEKEGIEEREMGIRMRVLGEVEGGLTVPDRAAVLGREKV